MASPFDFSVTLPSSLALIASDARAKPDPSQALPRFALQHTLSLPTGYGVGFGTSYSDKYEQTNHYVGAVAVAAKPFLNATRGARFNVLQRAARRYGKSVGVGHYSRDEEYEPADPDLPLCQILANPNGKRGGWSMARECAYLALQYHLTGDAPAWCVPNEAGKPVQFYALTSATVQLAYAAGVNPLYPKGAYRVMPYAGGGSFGLGGGMYAGAILPAEELHRLIDEDPWSRGLGRSRLQVGAKWIDVLEAITKSRWAFFEKGPQLGAAIVLPGADESVTSALSRQINEKHGGADQHGNRILVIGGGGMSDKAAIQTLGMTATEMEFLESHGQALEDVLALFGVPKPVACFTDSSNYATFYAAKQQFYDSTLVPFFLRMSDFLTCALAEPWSDEPGQYKIEVEPPPVGDVEMDEQQFQSDQQSGLLTWNQCLRKRNLPPVGPEGDVPAPLYLKKLEAQMMPQPAPAGLGGDPNAAPDAGAEQTAPDQDQGDDSPEATQDAVTQAALGALGVPADDSAPGAIAKAIAVSKPGTRVTRTEGQKWQVGGQWYTKKNGQSVKIGDPAKASAAPKDDGVAAEPAWDAAPGSGAKPAAAAPDRHDAMAAKLLNGRPSLDLLAPGPDGRAAAHKITDGASLKAFVAKGGRLPPTHFAEAAKTVPAPTPAAQKTLATAPTWAGSQADKHADRVAAHFGITRERAHALLTDAIQKVAAHAAKTGGKVGGFTLTDNRTGKTAALSPAPAGKGPTAGAPPRPANPAAKGTGVPHAKAMSSLVGSDGGALVTPAQLGAPKKKRKRIAACVARVMKALEPGE